MSWSLVADSLFKRRCVALKEPFNNSCVQPYGHFSFVEWPQVGYFTKSSQSLAEPLGLQRASGPSKETLTSLFQDIFPPLTPGIHRICESWPIPFPLLITSQTRNYHMSPVEAICPQFVLSSTQSDYHTATHCHDWAAQAITLYWLALRFMIQIATSRRKCQAHSHARSVMWAARRKIAHAVQRCNSNNY